MASVGMMWHDNWILELFMDVIDPVSGIFALDIEGRLSLFVDIFFCHICLALCT